MEGIGQCQDRAQPCGNKIPALVHGMYLASLNSVEILQLQMDGCFAPPSCSISPENTPVMTSRTQRRAAASDRTSRNVAFAARSALLETEVGQNPVCRS